VEKTHENYCWNGVGNDQDVVTIAQAILSLQFSTESLRNDLIAWNALKVNK